MIKKMVIFDPRGRDVFYGAPRKWKNAIFYKFYKKKHKKNIKNKMKNRQKPASVLDNNTKKLS